MKSIRESSIAAAVGLLVLCGARVPAQEISAATVQTVATGDVHTLAKDLKGVEGPTVLEKGKVAIVAEPGDILVISAEGAIEKLATPGLGVAGTALGKHDMLYVAKMDGVFLKRAGAPGGAIADDLPTSGGAIVGIDLKTKASKTLYTQWEGQALRGPNDLVIDEWGDIWFTDIIEGAVYWARADGSAIHRMIYPLKGANGIALSPDHRKLYLASEGKLLAFAIAGRGALTTNGDTPQMQIVAQLNAKWRPDGIKTEANGNIILACWEEGLITISADGKILSQTKLPGQGPANLVFGGPDMRTLYMTVELPGRVSGGLAWIRWPRAGSKPLPAGK